MIYEHSINEVKVICKGCAMHSNVPGVMIDSEGYCQYCTKSPEDEKFEMKYGKYLQMKMNHLFEEVKKQGRDYDVLVLFSGGKDCTYLLKIIKEYYELKPLALCIGVPVLGENVHAKENLEIGRKQFGVDLLYYYIDDDIYKKAIKLALLKGQEYGLDEGAGTDIFSFMCNWIGFKMALKMDIPIVVSGHDKTQGTNLFTNSEEMKKNVLNGVKPKGGIHDIFADALKQQGCSNGHILDLNIEKLRDYEFPSIIAPFTFIDYDYIKNFSDFERSGLDPKRYDKAKTLDGLDHFFDFISFKKYDCPGSIRQYSISLRHKYNALMSLNTNNTDNLQISREEIITIMDEYKGVLNYIVENRLNKSNITEKQKNYMKDICKNAFKIFEKDACEIFISNMLDIEYYSNLFDIDLSKL